jgi:hypothetical protein
MAEWEVTDLHRHDDVFEKYLAKYPESFDAAVPEI